VKQEESSKKGRVEVKRKQWNGNEPKTSREVKSVEVEISKSALTLTRGEDPRFCRRPKGERKERGGGEGRISQILEGSTADRLTHVSFLSGR